MANIEEPMGIKEGWSQIKAKAIDVLLDQLQLGFKQGARPFDSKFHFFWKYFSSVPFQPLKTKSRNKKLLYIFFLLPVAFYHGF